MRRSNLHELFMSLSGMYGPFPSLREQKGAWCDRSHHHHKSAPIWWIEAERIALKLRFTITQASGKSLCKF